MRHGSSSASGQETEVARVIRERDEALERETATADVLRVISSSPGDLRAVFQAILENATRICQANFGTLYLVEGDAYRTVAMHNAPPAFAARSTRNLPESAGQLHIRAVLELVVESNSLQARRQGLYAG